MSIGSTKWSRRDFQRDARETCDAISVALAASIVLLLASGVFLCARRLSGALEVPLAPVPLAVTATGLIAWATAVRLRLRDRRIPWLVALVLGLFAVACSYPGAGNRLAGVAGSIRGARADTGEA